MVTSTMEQPSIGSRRHDETEFSLKEWALRARISRENTCSRRYSASYIRSFREDRASRPHRSNVTISSTASSPGYGVREEIDPSTYSFTTALKALQAKTIYSWEYMSPEGLALNSKWSEAERYICNPLSGEVPLECLSAKALSARSFRHISSRITMSAPLIYPAHQPRQFHMKLPITTLEDEVKTATQENKIDHGMTRDIGIQSTPVDDTITNSPPSPVPTPSIEERSIKRDEAESGDSPISSVKGKFEEVVEMKETREEEEDAKGNEAGEKKKSKQMICSRCSRQGGCLSWRSLWMKRRHQKNIIHKPRMRNIFLWHVNAC